MSLILSLSETEGLVARAVRSDLVDKQYALGDDVDGEWLVSDALSGASVMPQRPAHPCAEPGCPALVRGANRCEKHTKPREQPRTQEYDAKRGSASQRGYGVRWRRLRIMFLNAHPMCADPFREHGDRLVPATDVDHVVSKRDGGRDEWSNLQSLCHSCHSRKTARGRGVKNPSDSKVGPTLESVRVFSRN